MHQQARCLQIGLASVNHSHVDVVMVAETSECSDDLLCAQVTSV